MYIHRVNVRVTDYRKTDPAHSMEEPVHAADRGHPRGTVLDRCPQSR